MHLNLGLEGVRYITETSEYFVRFGQVEVELNKLRITVVLTNITNARFNLIFFQNTLLFFDAHE
jgi:hypothetical protein